MDTKPCSTTHPPAGFLRGRRSTAEPFGVRHCVSLIFLHGTRLRSVKRVILNERACTTVTGPRSSTLHCALIRANNVISGAVAARHGTAQSNGRYFGRTFWRWNIALVGGDSDSAIEINKRAITGDSSVRSGKSAIIIIIRLFMRKTILYRCCYVICIMIRRTSIICQ